MGLKHVEHAPLGPDKVFFTGAGRKKENHAHGLLVKFGSTPSFSRQPE
jgi:hypothetical protein